MKRHFPLVMIGVVLVAAIGGGVALYRSMKTGGGDATPFASPTEAAPAARPPTAAASQNSGSPALTQPQGLQNVSVAVEEYGDYQCPPCGVLHPELRKIQAEYGNRIEFVFYNFPLTKNHKNALAAAQAAEAARLQNRFEKMHDRIYDNQEAWKDVADPRPTFLKYAGEIGLDLARFTRDTSGPEVQRRIDQDTQRAMSLGIQGTPTVLIEGRQLKPEVTTGEGIRRGIDVMLAGKAGTQ
jgi:protein-disulfide isomerase